MKIDTAEDDQQADMLTKGLRMHKFKLTRHHQELLGWTGCYIAVGKPVALGRECGDIDQYDTEPYQSWTSRATPSHGLLHMITGRAACLAKLNSSSLRISS